MEKAPLNKIELLKMVLDGQQGYIFSEEDYFSKDFFEICYQYGIGKVLVWVAPPSELGAKLYYHWVKCEKCGNEENIYSNIAEFRASIHSFKYPNKPRKKRYICNNCKPFSQEEQNKLEILEKEERANIFINQLLNSNQKIPLKIQIFHKHRTDLISSIDQNKIADYIQNIPYKDFLNTPYWKLISWYVKAYSNFKCKLCGDNQNLNVHHPAYNCHGYEMQNYKDLICLCESCHSRHHNRNNI